MAPALTCLRGALSSAAPARPSSSSRWGPTLAARRRARLPPPPRAGDEERRTAAGPMGSRDMEELLAEMGQLDMDAVTQQFGDNFGARPDFFQEKTMEELKAEFDGLIDMEEVGGVFKSDSDKSVKFPMDEAEEEEDVQARRAEEQEDEILDRREQEDLRANEEMGKKLGWEPATEEARAWHDQIQEEFDGSDPLAGMPQEEYSHLSKFIMELVHAGKKFDALVEENIDIIDVKLLTLLERRAAMAARDGSDVRVVHGLQKIWKRLSAEMERRDAPDELKLLDTCLSLMMPEDPMQEFDPKHMLAAKRDVAELLDEAFALPLSRHRPMDVFDVARKIGPQQDLDIDKLEAEHGDVWGSELSRESFIEMVREVIEETEERHAEEYEALQEIAADLEDKDMGYGAEEKKLAAEQIEQMHREIDAQKRTLGVTREVLRMAEAMTWA